MGFKNGRANTSRVSECLFCTEQKVSLEHIMFRKGVKVVTSFPTKIKSIVEFLKNSKVGGPDNITGDMLRNGGESLMEAIHS